MALPKRPKKKYGPEGTFYSPVVIYFSSRVFGGLTFWWLYTTVVFLYCWQKFFGLHIPCCTNQILFLSIFIIRYYDGVRSSMDVVGPHAHIHHREWEFPNRSKHDVVLLCIGIRLDTRVLPSIFSRLPTAITLLDLQFHHAWVMATIHNNSRISFLLYKRTIWPQRHNEYRITTNETLLAQRQSSG